MEKDKVIEEKTNQKLKKPGNKKRERLSKNRANEFASKLLTKALIFIILVLIALFALYVGWTKVSKPKVENKYLIVNQQLSFCQELVTLKYRYSDIVSIKKSAAFSSSYSIVKYSGIIRAGIADITYVDFNISPDGKTLRITLPDAEILGNEIVSQEVFDEKQSIFVPITFQEVMDEIENSKKEALEEIIADGVLDDAKEYAKKIVKQIMLAAGFEEVLVY